jgi:hypothetical protein
MRTRRLVSILSIAAMSAVVVGALGPARATHSATLAFAPSVRPLCQQVTGGNCGRNLEPAIVVDPAGNLYMSSIVGVPGGVNLWKRAVGSNVLQYVGMPDALPTVTPTTGLAPGGGDVDLAVATTPNSSGNYNLYVASLSAASVTWARSEDGGATWHLNVISTAPHVDVDRQWIAADGANTAYLVYRDGAPTMWWIKVTHDGGETFSAPSPLITTAAAAMSPLGPASRAGNLAIDHTTKDVYMPFTNVQDPVEGVLAANDPTSTIKRHVVYIARWHESATGAPALPSNSVVFNGPPSTRVDAIFPTTAVDSAGNVYVSWSTTAGVFLSVSKNKGLTWAAATQISQAPATSTIQPWAVAGDAGRVAVAFLGTSAASLEDPTAQWHSYVSLSTDGNCQWAATPCTAPTFQQIEASDHVMHSGTVCLLGLRCDVNGLAGVEPNNRALAEVTALAVDKDGLLVTSWPDDSAGPTYPYVAKQTGGPAMVGDPAPADLLSIVQQVIPPPTYLTPTTQTLHFSSTTPAGKVDEAQFFANGTGGPQMSLAAAAGAGGVMETSRFGNPGLEGNPLLAFFVLPQPVKLQGTPSVSLWISAPDSPPGSTLKLSAELWIDGVASYGAVVAGSFVPITVDITTGPVPTQVTFNLPAVDKEALERVTLQFGVTAPTASAQPKTALLLYGSAQFDSTLTMPMGFVAP